MWSFFWGRMWIFDWLDGSIVFGGYDSNLVFGEKYTGHLDYKEDEGYSTGLKVPVIDISLKKWNGVEVSIAPNDFAQAFCIVP